MFQCNMVPVLVGTCWIAIVGNFLPLNYYLFLGPVMCMVPSTSVWSIQCYFKYNLLYLVFTFSCSIQDEQGSEVLIGVSHEGIATYKDRLVVNRIPW